jgi:outer membrane biosynthesis protein TonB
MEKNRIKSFLASLLVHISLLFLSAYSNIFSFWSEIKDREEVITLEMVNISDTVNIKTQTVQKDKEIKNDDAKNIKNTKNLSSEEPKEEESKKEVPKKDEPKEEEDLDKVKFNTKKEKEEPKKKKEETKEEKKDQEKPKEKNEIKKIEKNDDQKKKSKEKTIDDLMKQLEKESQGKNPASKNRKIEKSAAKTDSIGNSDFDKEKAQSISDQEYMNSKISKHWNKIGIENESGRIKVRIRLNIDGSLDSISDINAPSEVAKNSIIRAVKMAAPYDKLDVDRYDSWAEMEIEFDLSRD